MLLLLTSTSLLLPNFLMLEPPIMTLITSIEPSSFSVIVISLLSEVDPLLSNGLLSLVNLRS